MARFSKIDRRVWSDDKFRRLSSPEPNAKFLWLFLLTNPYVGVIPGVYSAGEAMLAEMLGWRLEGFREAFEELFREGLVKADFEARLLWVPNAVHYNHPENPNVVKGWQCAWDELPECELKREAWEGLRASLSSREEWLEAFREACPEPSVKGTAKGMPKGSTKGSVKGSPKGMANQEQEQGQEPEQEKIASDFNSTEAAQYVCQELTLAGTEMRWMVRDAIDAKQKKSSLSVKAIAELMVFKWRSYSKANQGIKFAKGVKSFFGSGEWDSSPVGPGPMQSVSARTRELAEACK